MRATWLSPLVVAALGLLACSTPQRTGDTANGRSGSPTDFVPSGVPELDDAELDCRSSQFDFIAASADALAPDCDARSMERALAIFDLGTIAGYQEANAYVEWRGAWCMCRTTGGCPDDRFVELSERFQELSENDGRAEREGVLQLTNRYADHRCIQLDVAVGLFKAGYPCGYMRGLSSPQLRKSLETNVEEILPDDPTAKTRARECWDRLQPPT